MRVRVHGTLARHRAAHRHVSAAAVHRGAADSLCGASERVGGVAERLLVSAAPGRARLGSWRSDVLPAHQGGGFYAFFVFYGGFTIGLLAYPAAVFGAWPVFLASMVAAVVGGYLGIWWAARNLGLSRRLAVLPGLIYATTPYVLSDAYGRGAWAELVAVNAAAVMVGAWTALLPPTGRRRTLALAALVGSAAVLAGTHNVTLLMRGGAAADPPGAAAVHHRGHGASGRPSVARSRCDRDGAWRRPDSRVADPEPLAGTQHDRRERRRQQGHDQRDGAVRAPGNVLSPWPVVPDLFDGEMWIYAQAPVFAIGWVLVAFVVVMIGSRRGAPRGLVASSVALLAVGAGLLVLIVHPLWWLSFRRPCRRSRCRCACCRSWPSSRRLPSRCCSSGSGRAGRGAAGRCAGPRRRGAGAHRDLRRDVE